jgi:hypothetical protein
MRKRTKEIMRMMKMKKKKIKKAGMMRKTW